jgi:hypothetical protein
VLKFCRFKITAGVEALNSLSRNFVSQGSDSPPGVVGHLAEVHRCT